MVILRVWRNTRKTSVTGLATVAGMPNIAAPQERISDF